MFKLNGIITIEADNTLTFNVNAYSKDMRTEYGMMCVSHGKLVKVIGKKQALTEEVWPVVKQAFNL